MNASRTLNLLDTDPMQDPMQDPIVKSKPLCCWNTFKIHFINIIKYHDYYNKIFIFLQHTKTNALLYGAYGFPTDLFIDEIIKHKFSLTNIYKKECVWNKDLIYYYNPMFLELDLMHPNIPKDMTILCKFILSVIKNKNIHNDKHFIIIKHIDILAAKDFNSFRIILERFSNNVYFLCTTHKLAKIDVPVKSRFALFRMPLFEHNEILKIFRDYLHIPLNPFLSQNKSRDIIKALFIANCDCQDEDFCNFNFPLISGFYKNLKKNNNSMEEYRTFAYKCFQFNIGIPQLLSDLLKLIPNKQKQRTIKIAADIEYLLQSTNKGRESIYIESFLCQVLL